MSDLTEKEPDFKSLSKEAFKVLICFLVVCGILLYLIHIADDQLKPSNVKTVPVEQPAPIEVAKIFARSTAKLCREATPDFIYLVADKATKAGLKPSLAASVIDQESGCDPLAVSNRGAIGLTQIVVKVWSGKIDFENQNPFNKDLNLTMGFGILSELVNQYGEKEALRRYQGVGTGGNTDYVNQVISRQK